MSAPSAGHVLHEVMTQHESQSSRDGQNSLSAEQPPAGEPAVQVYTSVSLHSSVAHVVASHAPQLWYVGCGVGAGTGSGVGGGVGSGVGAPGQLQLYGFPPDPLKLSLEI